MLAAILGIDLGTKCGWAYLHSKQDKGVALISGVWDCSIKTGVDSPSLRFTKFERQLDDLLSLGPDLVAYEIVHAHRGVQAGHMYGAFQAKLFERCERMGVPVKGFAVQTIKKFATGKGNADKEAVIAAVRGWGFSPKDDNEADAIALSRLVWEDM